MKDRDEIRYRLYDLARGQQEIRMLLYLVLHQEVRMAGELDALRAQVTRNTEVDESAIVLLNGIKALLDAAIASGNPQALLDLSTQLGTSTDALAAAVAANTPAVP